MPQVIFHYIQYYINSWKILTLVACCTLKLTNTKTIVIITTEFPCMIMLLSTNLFRLCVIMCNSTLLQMCLCRKSMNSFNTCITLIMSILLALLYFVSCCWIISGAFWEDNHPELINSKIEMTRMHHIITHF